MSVLPVLLLERGVLSGRAGRYSTEAFSRRAVARAFVDCFETLAIGKPNVVWRLRVVCCAVGLFAIFVFGGKLVAGALVLAPDDPRYRREDEGLEIQIPVEFWKIVMFRDGGDGKPSLRGFVLTKRDLVNKSIHAQTLEFEEFRWFQVPIADIGKRTGLRFGSPLQAIERMPAPQALGGRKPSARLIQTTGDFFA